MPEPEPLVMTDAEHVGEQKFYMSDDMFPVQQIVDADGTVIDEVLPKPIFTVQEVAKFFFGKSSDWMRWRIQPDKPPAKASDEEKANWVPRYPNGMLVLDGEPLPERRTKSNYRYYTLADVEKMAHALKQHNAIDGHTLNTAVSLVKYVAEQYRII